ncbi:NeuD/PglB/VioB family sugar acetyltransferase [Pseudobutyrivibrio xylanivorans]|uniref:PglD N-terminal domain-containing protein n=1 Tax=Pseudobutyrivibrio xylanivorans TaxID=185007 RepID=A0A5P6VMM2_PSEXY|nr:NeuD/PglB/VioB family sugar acetyltransferase [Pseudobutyrivibrio xylanivorans]QFJ53905.1 hypothetical protein FXF36_02995 [Pseudobutyrivibrio xylanivorans]
MILGIYGAGGNGKLVADLALYENEAESKWDKIIFVDDVVGVEEKYGLEVYTFSEVREKIKPQDIEMVISLGEPCDRELVFERIKEAGYSLGQAISPDAYVTKDVKIGEGVIIFNCSVGSDVILGDNVFVSEGALIGHDITIGPHGVIGARAFVAGHCQLGEQVYIGPCAVLRDRIKIEDTAVVAIGAVVFKDVSGNSIAIGNPARSMKKEEGYRIF